MISYFHLVLLADDSVFPEELIEQGLSEEVLYSTLSNIQLQVGSSSHFWKLNGIPSIGFYRTLHTYLKRQPNITKMLIGKFYTTIDCNFQEKGSRPDNIYRFVENIAASKRHSYEPMVYNMPVINNMLNKNT